MLASPAYQSRPVFLSWLDSWHCLSPTAAVSTPQNSSTKLSALYSKRRLPRQLHPLLFLGRNVDLPEVVAVLTIDSRASQSTLASCEHICSSEDQMLRGQGVHESQIDNRCSPPALANDTRQPRVLNRQDGTSETFAPLSIDRDCSEAAKLGEKDVDLIEKEKVRRRKISQANKGQVPWNKPKNIIAGVIGSESAADTHTTEGKSQVCCNKKGDDDEYTMLLKEKLRRQRISHANRGKVPWNKGRQHSEETKQRIRERTFEAMKDSKVREKLRVRAQSPSLETRLKIKESMIQTWTLKKKTRMLQQSILGEWEEAIADSARIGGHGDVAYQWNSFASELVAMKAAWRKKRRKMKVRAGFACISLRHRANISKAIKAKWADPRYRSTVKRGMDAFWQKRVEGKIPADDITHASSSDELKEVDIDTLEDLPLQPSVKCESDKFGDLEPQESVKCLPVYSNPLSDTRLEKLKQIRANRLLDRLKRKEATDRARLLMEEAQKAARALEAAAAKDKNALVSLLEAQKLLAEAAQSFDLAQMHTRPSMTTARQLQADSIFLS